MLSRLTLENFRGFARHTVPFRTRSVLVGPNNAGKSTIAEALRLVALVTARFGNANFREVPKWLDLGKAYRGFAPDLDRTEFDFGRAFHRYNEPPAVVRADFANGTRLEIYIGGQDAVHAVTFTANGTVVHTKAQAANVQLPRVAACPQVGPLALEEKVLTAEYVRRTVDTPRGSQLLRNQIFRSPRYLAEFQALVSDLWPGIRVRELDLDEDLPAIPGDPRGDLSLFIQEGPDFVAEASRFGHGLQICLQIAWFLTRTEPHATVVLDEPDVYLHPDVQRRLFRAVSTRFNQCIVTTHSAEIMADAAPSEVVIVNKTAKESQFATSLPAVQEVIDRLGGVHNLSLAKLANARRFVLVEGEDLNYLAPIHRMLFPTSIVDLRDLPSADVGGWSGWERVVGAASAMHNALGERMEVYAIFDSDYYPLDVIAARYARAADYNVNLHVWRRKELESYFVVPATLARVITDRARSDPGVVTSARVEVEIERIVDTLRAETVAAIGDALLTKDRRAGGKSAFLAADRLVAEKWKSKEGRWGLVNAKSVFSSLSEWAQREFGCSFGVGTVVRSMQAEDVAPELFSVISALEHGRPFERSKDSQ
jgi:hypothetical protein